MKPIRTEKKSMNWKIATSGLRPPSWSQMKQCRCNQNFLVNKTGNSSTKTKSINMNINQFQTLNSNVLSVEPTNTGIAIWVKYEGGREGSYRVNDPSFSAREGHQLTAIMCGIHPIAIINRNTNIKIQLLNGYDLLGTGPEVKSRSLIFWLGWAIFLVPFSNLDITELK